MTAIAERVPCPGPDCTYATDAASMAAHVAMTHKGIDMRLADPRPREERVSPKRSARKAPSAQTVPAPAASDPPAAVGAPAIAELDLDLVDVGHNVRINVAELEELAASIAEHGVLQPIKATGPHADGRYLVTWGQRRTLASRMAGRTTIPAIVLPPTADVDADGAARSIEQLVENLHRADLPAMDRARSIRKVIDSGVTAAELARKLGIAPSTISNDLGLLEAPAEIQQLLEAGQITAAHAKAMKGLAPKTQVEVAKMAVEHGFSAHRTEQEVQERKRRADLEAQHRKERAEELEQRRTQVDASIAAAIAKTKIPLDAEVLVEAGYYGANDTATWLVHRLEAAGLTNVRKIARWNEAQPRPAGDVCDCTAWQAKQRETYNYSEGRTVTYSVSLTKACTNGEHQVAKEKATYAKLREKEAVAHRVQQHVRRTAAGWAIPEGRAIAIDRILAESLLWGLLSYRIPEWAQSHGGSKKNPFAAIRALSDEDLAKELAMEAASDFRDKAGYHVDWPALAAEYGLEDAS